MTDTSPYNSSMLFCNGVAVRGELVQRGALVAMGYWNDPEKTAERFKPLPDSAPGRQPGLVLPEIAVFSGDTVRRDEEGYLYFIGRRDEMMKTSGYRVSPTEVEEVLYATKLVGECVAFGVDHDALGQSIQVIATPPDGGELDVQALLAAGDARIHLQPGHVQLLVARFNIVRDVPAVQLLQGRRAQRPLPAVAMRGKGMAVALHLVAQTIALHAQ